ncbi:PAS domain S-box protein [Polaromonas jejuensis]|uniref:histidine kinase n=1 Tax=Polaromonas jejuensis TaxID=457502 RepID=A0ABW0QAR9_9BURK|nr:PAS domain S-box protein [Polaromonas jejuensis]
MKIQITLRARLVILVVAAIVPLFGLSMFKAWLNADAAVARALTELQFTVSLAASSQQRMTETAHQLLTAIAHVPDIRDGKVLRCNRYLAELKQLFPGYANLGIVGADGYARCNGVSGPPGYLGDRAYFRDAVARRRFVAGEYIVGRLTGKPSITYALPALDGDGRVSFVAYAGLDLNEMSKSVAALRLPPGAAVGIHDRHGILLAGTSNLPLQMGQRVASTILQEAAKAMTPGVREGPDGKGQQRLWAYMPSSPLADTALLVAVSMDRSLVVGPSQRQLGLELAALALLAFLGGGLAWAIGGRAIVAPTRQILQATHRLTGGDLDVRIPSRSLYGGSEFAVIADGFNLMADSLQQRERQLGIELERSRQAYSTLELTINSMHESLVAVDTAGRSLLINEPAQKIFAIDDRTRTLSAQWAQQQGFFVPGSQTLIPGEDLPLAKALKGESGGPMHILMRNDRVPQGRLLSCSYRPMHRGADIVGALCIFADITEVDRLQQEQAGRYAQLRETQRRLLDAQRLGRIGIWELDLRTQKLWVSDEVYDLYDVARGAFDGHAERLLEFIHPEDRERYLQQQRYAGAQAGLPMDVEYRIITPAGEARWMHQYERLQTNGEGQALYRTGVIQEITERRRAELVIARNTELLNRTGALARVGGWELVLETMTPYWSDEVYRIHELAPSSEALGVEAAISFYAPEAQPVLRAAVDAALQHASPWDMELPLITAMGRRLWVRTQGRALLQDGKVVRLVGVLQDITEQHESQAHLRLLETCVSRLNDIVLITEAEPFDEPGPRIVFVNEAFERRTGYSREEVLGKSPRILQGPKTQRHELDRIGAALRKWRPVQSELINYTKDGEAFWIELDMVPIADAKGRFTHWVAVERDITRRKLAEQALVDSEQRYAALFEDAPVPMWVLDIATWQFLTVNNAAVESYGYSTSEFLSMTLFDIRPEEDNDRLREQLGEDATAKRERVSRHRRKDGAIFPVAIVSRPVQYAGRAARFVVVMDVTAQVKAEKDVQDYLFTLQRAADATQAITWHQTLEGTMQEVAEQARGVIGTHQSMVSFTVGSDWTQAINALSISEKYANDRGRIALPDGSGIDALVCENNRSMRLTQAELEAHPRWQGFGRDAGKRPPMRGWLAIPLMGRTGKNIGLLQLSDKYEGEFTQQDEYVAMELAQLASIAIENAQLLEEISQLNAGLEQKVAERTVALARQEALFRALAEQAPQLVWTAKPNGAATYFNRTWLELVGGELDDWTGSKWFAVIHPEDLPSVQAGWQEAMTNRAQYVGIRRILAKDGSCHTMSYRASPVLDSQGEVAFWVGIDADITEVKAIEAALRLSNQELEAFSYSVSHDLRSPLNTIDGFSRLLAKQLTGNESEKVQHYLSRIQAGVAQMGQLIEDLLSLAQVSRVQLQQEAVDLSALAHGILGERQARQPGRDVVVQIETDLQAHGDGRLIRVVLENLLSNAWKFTAQQARAEIMVGQKFDAAGLPVFFVRDNGAGFDMAYADKLFNPFQRLHAASEFPGTGIGLATASRVIGRHGGKLWAEAAPGRGACFFFTLPRTVLSV